VSDGEPIFIFEPFDQYVEGLSVCGADVYAVGCDVRAEDLKKFDLFVRRFRNECLFNVFDEFELQNPWSRLAFQKSG
jgi:hypothetical protein